MTEQERFEVWFFKHKREQHSILWGANEPNAALGCKLRLEASHNDMWLAWQAAQQKEGYVLVPVEINDLNHPIILAIEKGIVSDTDSRIIWDEIIKTTQE